MYRTTLTIIAMFFTSFLFGQKNAQDVVYLKNGSIIRGFISEFIPDSSVTIKTEGQSVFVFKMNEVEKITREEAPRSKKDWTPYIKDKGYFNETELRLLIGKGEDKFNTGQSLITVNGYRVNRYFKVGAGFGVAHYNEYSHTFFPIFARVSGDMIKFWVTPIYFADAGYSFMIEKDEYPSGTEGLSSKGGLLIHVGTGLRFYTANKAAFTITTGFSLQKSSRQYQYTWSEGYVYDESRTYRRITFGLGISF